MPTPDKPDDSGAELREQIELTPAEAKIRYAIVQIADPKMTKYIDEIMQLFRRELARQLDEVEEALKTKANRPDKYVRMNSDCLEGYGLAAKDLADIIQQKRKALEGKTQNV